MTFPPPSDWNENITFEILFLLLPPLRTAGLGDMNRPDTHTMGEKPTAGEQRRESSAFLWLKRCFGGLRGNQTAAGVRLMNQWGPFNTLRRADPEQIRGRR